jgi:putative FmdB family regulatory protein
VYHQKETSTPAAGSALNEVELTYQSRDRETMPTYDYVCDACEHEWEEFQSMTVKPTKKCPKCKKSKARRRIGPGAGIIFKGSGFYITDYRSDSYKKAADADKKTTAGDSGKGSESAKSDSTKSESKAASSDSGSKSSESKPSKSKD